MFKHKVRSSALVWLLIMFPFPVVAQTSQLQFRSVPQQNLLAAPENDSPAPVHLAKANSETTSAREPNLNLFLPLAVGVYAAAFLDMHESISRRPHFEERDPLAKPLMVLPGPAYYATGTTLSTSINWLGWKMAHSKRWHCVWWLPQVTSICGNVFGYVYTLNH